jgi:hypothetical protein
MSRHPRLVSVFRSAIAALAIALAAPANASIIFTFNAADAVHVDYSITGSYADLASGLAFTSGNWTITLDSPVPSGEPGAGDAWSLRVVIQYAGLTGERVDYFGGRAGIAIDTFDVNNLSGDFIPTFAFAAAFLSLSSRTDWAAGGSHSLDLGKLPEPGSLALLGLALAAAATARRRPVA